MKKNDLLILKAVNNTHILLWAILLVISSTVTITAAYSAEEIAIQNQYLQNMQQCERQLAPAQCQRKANLKYATEQHTLKQQKIVQTQAIRALKMQQNTVYPRLSQQQKISKNGNKRPLLQGNLPKSNTIILKRPRLITAKQHSHTPVNRRLIKPVKVKSAIHFTKRQAESNQKSMRRLAKNNKRREQGFIVDRVIVPQP
jgi:hypothetical protein